MWEKGASRGPVETRDASTPEGNLQYSDWAAALLWTGNLWWFVRNAQRPLMRLWLPGSHLPPVGHCELGARQCGLSTRVCGATTSTPYRTPGRRPTKSRREAQGCAQVMRDLEVMLHLVTVLRNIHNPPLESARVRHQGARAVCARALDAAEDRQPAGKRADRIPSVPHLIAGRCQCWRLKP